jgi:hypothetical protein
MVVVVVVVVVKETKVANEFCWHECEVQRPWYQNQFRRCFQVSASQNDLFLGLWNQK